LSAGEAIVAATAGSAAALGSPDRGTVAPGAVADLLVVDGDPIADPTCLTSADRIVMVLQAGRVVGGASPVTGR
jgi:imidazolonepropionase-like amidohydrolase